jgi:NADPH:quinone reductase-like Zn-dependent oxidoreductase
MSTRLGARTTRTAQEPTTMKAITRDRFGAPDVLERTTTTIPEPAAGEVLIEVDAAGVNHGDSLELRGWPYAARLMGHGLVRPRRRVLGTDVVGRVGALGPGVGSLDVEGLDVGDQVVGWTRSGAFAEFATVPVDAAIPKPRSMTDVEAAALPTAGVTALQAVRRAGAVAGADVLVVGASGGVGTFAVQIAAAFGAVVTGVTSDANADLVRSLGAAAVVDYRRCDFTAHAGRYDVIVDLVGDRPLRQVRRALTRSGTLVVVGGQHPQTLTGMRRFATAGAMSPAVTQRIVPLFAAPVRDDLATLAALAEEGTVRTVVDRTFDLPATADAIRHLEGGHARGKVAVTT